MHRIMFRPHATWNTRYDFTGHGGQASSCIFRAPRILGWRWRVPATGAAACQCGPFRCHAAALLHGLWAVCGSRGSRNLGVSVHARMETQWDSSECLVVLCPDPDAEAGASLAAWVWTWTCRDLEPVPSVRSVPTREAARRAWRSWGCSQSRWTSCWRMWPTWRPTRALCWASYRPPLRPLLPHGWQGCAALHATPCP